VIDHRQEKRGVSDQWGGSYRGTAIALFPINGFNERDIAATSFCDTLEFVPNECRIASKNDDKSLDTSREQLCYRSLGY
jgi:hypothetical protein